MNTIELILLVAGTIAGIFGTRGYYRKPISDDDRKHRDDDIIGDDGRDSIDDHERLDPPPPIEVEVPEIDTDLDDVLFIIDRGHGALTEGKRSPRFESGEQLLEWKFNLDVGQRVIDKGRAAGLKIVDLVPDQDLIGNFLQGRVDRANAIVSELPKVFISIHANAGPVVNEVTDWAHPSIAGVEVWHFHGSEAGFAMANIFCDKIVEATGWRNRGPMSKSTGQFYVLRKTKMTAILTENGFYNNKRQGRELLRDTVRDAIAQAHVDAMIEVIKRGVIR